MASSTSPLFRSSASWSKLSMPLGLPSGTASVTLFSRRSMRLSVTMRSRPLGFFSVSPMRLPSIAFICVGAAEMKRSQSAPSLIWVRSLPEESKLKVSVTFGATSLYIPAISLSVSVMEAAAKTISSTGSAASSCVSASFAPSSLLPQAVRASTSERARSRDNSFFMFGHFLSKIFFFAHSLKSAAIQERARTRRTQFISNPQRGTWTKSFRYPQNR